MRWLNRVGPFAVLAAGPIAVAATPPGRPVEGVLGAVLAFALLLPLADASRTIGRARPGSLVDGADWRRPWLIALSAALLVLPLGVGAPAMIVPALLLTGGAITIVLAIDVRALVRLRRGLAGSERLRARTADSPPIDGATAVYDFGLGDGEREELAPPAAIYRERERVLRIVRGSHAEAQRALVRGIVLDVIVPLPGVIALAGVLAAYHPSLF
jgi:hypothetical protein